MKEYRYKLVHQGIMKQGYNNTALTVESDSLYRIWEILISLYTREQTEYTKDYAMGNNEIEPFFKPIIDSLIKGVDNGSIELKQDVILSTRHFDTKYLYKIGKAYNEIEDIIDIMQGTPKFVGGGNGEPAFTNYENLQAEALRNTLALEIVTEIGYTLHLSAHNDDWLHKDIFNLIAPINNSEQDKIYYRGDLLSWSTVQEENNTEESQEETSTENTNGFMISSTDYTKEKANKMIKEKPKDN